VLVGEEVELLIVPLRRGLFDRLRGRVPVNVTQRIHGHATPYATVSRLGRHPCGRCASSRTCSLFGFDIPTMWRPRLCSVNRVSVESALVVYLVMELVRRLPRAVPAITLRLAGRVTRAAMPGVFALPVNFPQQPPAVKARMLAADRLCLQAVS
jgi:hypothetical protein